MSSKPELHSEIRESDLDRDDLLTALGFNGDPFEYTDADREPKLSDYFVAPPYFSAVVGDPTQPTPAVVFAPRGSGKSAQRRMIEERADESQDTDSPFLSVTYDEFDQPEGFALEDASWNYHIEQLIRLTIVQLLVALEEDSFRSDALSDSDKEILSSCIREFVETMTAEQYRLAVRSVRSLKQRAENFWSKYGGPVGILVNAILKAHNLPAAITTGASFSTNPADNSNRKLVFQELVRIARTLGFCSVYVLVDRIDEISSTANSSNASFELIRALLSDLSTLETGGVGFKFFLWDKLVPLYKPISRPDRVKSYSLRWRFGELEDVLSNRLRSYSDGKVTSFNQFFDTDVILDIHKLVCRLGAGSPRDVIRLCSRIIAENGRGGTSGSLISEDIFRRGAWEFCRERADELCDLADISRS